MLFGNQTGTVNFLAIKRIIFEAVFARRQNQRGSFVPPNQNQFHALHREPKMPEHAAELNYFC
jgi:hypothetical protein